MSEKEVVLNEKVAVTIAFMAEEGKGGEVAKHLQSFLTQQFTKTRKVSGANVQFVETNIPEVIK